MSEQEIVDWAVDALKAQREWGENEAGRWMRFAVFVVFCLLFVAGSACIGVYLASL